jgi:hypothetical protein
MRNSAVCVLCCLQSRQSPRCRLLCRRLLGGAHQQLPKVYLSGCRGGGGPVGPLLVLLPAAGARQLLRLRRRRLLAALHAPALLLGVGWLLQGGRRLLGAAFLQAAGRHRGCAAGRLPARAADALLPLLAALLLLGRRRVA